MAKRGRPPEVVDIYGLCDPDTQELRYIGKSAHAPTRFKQHLGETRRRTPLYDWIAKLRREGKVPVLTVLFQCAPKDWQLAERWAIAVANREGEQLLNLAEGGDEPHCPHAVRVENGRNTARAIHDDEFRKRIWRTKRMIGQLNKQGYLTEEARVKARLAAKIAPHLFGAWATL